MNKNLAENKKNSAVAQIIATASKSIEVYSYSLYMAFVSRRKVVLENFSIIRNWVKDDGRIVI